MIINREPTPCDFCTHLVPEDMTCLKCLDYDKYEEEK